MNQNISALQDFREIATLPMAAALVALAVTWAVWYFTGNRCPEELAAATGCNASAGAVFINPALLKDIVTNSAIAATGGGIWSYIMITRERRAREAAEQTLAQERRKAEARVEEERRKAEARVEEERRKAEARAEEERRKAEEERRKAEEERRKAEAERRKAEERAEEERNRLLAEIERLTRQLDSR